MPQWYQTELCILYKIGSHIMLQISENCLSMVSMVEVLVLKCPLFHILSLEEYRNILSSIIGCIPAWVLGGM
jgi:hypothetical protein